MIVALALAAAWLLLLAAAGLWWTWPAFRARDRREATTRPRTLSPRWQHDPSVEPQG